MLPLCERIKYYGAGYRIFNIIPSGIFYFLKYNNCVRYSFITTPTSTTTIIIYYTRLLTKKPDSDAPTTVTNTNQNNLCRQARMLQFINVNSLLSKRHKKINKKSSFSLLTTCSNTCFLFLSAINCVTNEYYLYQLSTTI